MKVLDAYRGNKEKRNVKLRWAMWRGCISLASHSLSLPRTVGSYIMVSATLFPSS